MALVSGAVLLILNFLPTKWVMRAPGTAEPVAPMIRIPDQKTYLSMGRLYLTTVLVERASALLCLYAMLDPQAELVDPLDPGAPQRPVHDSRLATQMEQSQYLAKVAALRELGHPIHSEPTGVEILEVVPDSPAAGVLQTADVVVEAAGRPVRRSEDLKAALAGAPGGRPLAVAVQRGGRAERLEVPTLERDGHAWLGVAVRTRVEQEPLPLEIDIEPGPIDGASAGLMFALEIVDRLTPRDLTGGRLVAGTGAIDADGRVVEIAGADMKVLAAEEVGAQWFLCPAENASEARAAATRIEVVPVRTLAEAIARLEGK